jgi:hypothetical protein
MPKYLLADFKCKICDLEFKNSKNLGNHIKKDHNLSSVEYTIQELLNNEIPLCECGCGEKVKIYAYAVGICYRPSCSAKIYWNTIDKNSKEYINRNELIGSSSHERGMEKSRNLGLSHNPDDWKIECKNKCGNVYHYTNYGSYKRAMSNIRKDEPPTCQECRIKEMNGREVSEETKMKQSESAKNRKMTPEGMATRSRNLSIAHKARWANMNDEERQDISEKIRRGQARVVFALGASTSFRPRFNPDTIPYIVDILNIRYNTEFVHARSPSGEFRLYDEEYSRFYFADAYCPNLNIWVEFDESHHRNKRTKDYDRIREIQIRKCLDCQILRIPFDKAIY